MASDPRSLAALALGLGACRGAQSALDPQGPQARRLFDLTWAMVVGGTAIFVVVVALAVAAVALPRRGDDTADEAARNRRWKPPVTAGVALTVAALAALVVASVQASGAINARPRDPLRITVIARQWWWEVQYPGSPPSETVRTANELHVPVGRPVRVTLESRDVIHTFWVPNLHGKLDAIPGRQNALWFQADRPGVYRGQCAEFCGLQHARMAFLVIAESPEDFARWRAAQLRPADPPADDRALRGQEVFLDASCPLCHAVRGTDALAAAGPDLTHLASRRSLAAGTLPNRRGHLAGWILDPQHAKPGAFMPPNEIEGDRLDDLLHYLESLR